MLTLPDRTILPARRGDLLSLRGIIYAIVNSYDGKPYVGQTRNTFNERYGPRWWTKTNNVLLQRTLKHAKPEDFTVYILDHGLPDTAALNERERYYADQLNSYCPYGYNVRECGVEGEIYCPEVKAVVAKANEASRRTYQIQRIGSSDIITITHLRQWCRDNGVREMALRNLLCGLVQTSQGYCLPGTILRKRTRRGGIRGKGQRYTVKHISSGEIITFENAALFAEKHGLRLAAFKSMLNRKCRFSQGYCLPHVEPPPARLYGVTDPSGHTWTFENLAAFEREHNVNLRSLRHERSRLRSGWSNLTILREGTTVRAARDKPRPTQADPSLRST